MAQSALSKRLKVSLDELRMQVLGAQVLFGFQLQSLFQPGFEHSRLDERAADAVSLAAIVISFLVLVIPSCRHRLIERGEITQGLIRLSAHCAEVALATMALALGAIAYAIGAHSGALHPWLLAALAACLSGCVWFGSALFIRPGANGQLPEREMTDLHTKIDQMLTESRVVLPGVQAMLGFQLIVIMTQAFEHLPAWVKALHFTGLALTGASVALLIAPAAVHRLSFDGGDDERFFRIGSRLITSALLPLILSISLELAVAVWRLAEREWWVIAAALVVCAVFFTSWYGFPLLSRNRARPNR